MEGPRVERELCVQGVTVCVQGAGLREKEGGGHMRSERGVRGLLGPGDEFEL